uniref:Uncharacterized protein n=1 Tax=Arundo donax TaxID=35708 RepID=A0A0A9GNM2_ARUDO
MRARPPRVSTPPRAYKGA